MSEVDDKNVRCHQSPSGLTIVGQGPSMYECLYYSRLQEYLQNLVRNFRLRRKMSLIWTGYQCL